MRKIRKINVSQWTYLVSLFALWILIVVIRVNFAELLSLSWYFGLTVGFLLTLHIGWKAHSFTVENDE